MSWSRDHSVIFWDISDTPINVHAEHTGPHQVTVNGPNVFLIMALLGDCERIMTQNYFKRRLWNCIFQELYISRLNNLKQEVFCLRGKRGDWVAVGGGGILHNLQM